MPAEAKFAKGGLLPQLDEIIAVLPQADAEARFKAAREVVASCVGKSWTETGKDGTVTTYTLGDVSMPKIGQESFATRISASMKLGAVTVDLIFFRQGPVVGALGGIGGSLALVGTGQIDSSEWVPIAKAADRKLKQLTAA